MTSRLPQWAEAIREGIHPDDETTLIIAKQDNAEYLTLKRSEIDLYFTQQSVVKRRLQSALLFCVIFLMVFGLLSYASVLQHRSALQEKVSVIAGQTSAMETLMALLSVDNSFDTRAGHDFSTAAGILGQSLVAQRAALEFMAEQVRVLAPIELEARLNALRETQIDPAEFFDAASIAGLRGIGGARFSDVAALQTFFEDPVLEMLARFNDQALAVDALPMMTPIDKGRITSRFGIRRHPVTSHFQAHKGIDFVASSPRAEVIATHDGTVVFAGFEGDFGNVVKLRNDNGITTVYAHLSKIAVGLGTQVRRGELVGNIGNTGMSTSSHLHYEVHFQDRVIDPLRLSGLRDVW